MCSTWRQKILGPCSSRMCYIVSLAWKLERRRRGKFLDFVLQGEGKSQQDSSQANLLTCQYCSWAANACFFISCQISRSFSSMLFYHLFEMTHEIYLHVLKIPRCFECLSLYVLPFFWSKYEIKCFSTQPTCLFVFGKCELKKLYFQKTWVLPPPPLEYNCVYDKHL